MNEKIGLVNSEIKLVKKDDELIERIYESAKLRDPKTEVTPDKIRKMLRYNVWTTRQFSDLTGLAESTIANKCRPVYKDGELVVELDFTYTHEDFSGSGWKGIVRNEKSERLLP
jgi:hypothetical protein